MKPAKFCQVDREGRVAVASLTLGFCPQESAGRDARSLARRRLSLTWCGLSPLSPGRAPLLEVRSDRTCPNLPQEFEYEGMRCSNLNCRIPCDLIASAVRHAFNQSLCNNCHSWSYHNGLNKNRPEDKCRGNFVNYYRRLRETDELYDLLASEVSRWLWNRSGFGLGRSARPNPPSSPGADVLQDGAVRRATAGQRREEKGEEIPTRPAALCIPLGCFPDSLFRPCAGPSAGQEATSQAKEV